MGSVSPSTIGEDAGVQRTKPLVIDLYCGLGGWSKGFLSEGYRAVGFDIERHDYGTGGYPGDLVLQDILTVHGSQFRDAACIVASPPCQRYSYMAMPWKKAKALIAWHKESPERVKDLNALFDACFRIQLEASKAAGRYIPMVVENVRGAQPWVGRAKAHYGSYYLWGDVEDVGGRIVASGPLRFGQPSVKALSRRMKRNPDGTEHPVGSWFAVADSKNRGVTAKNETVGGGSWFAIGSPGQEKVGGNPDGRKQPGHSGRKWFADPDVAGHLSSKSSARKAASAAIAEIPFELASIIARSFRP